MHAQCIMDATAAKTAEQVRKALQRQEQQRLWIARAGEMARGSQGGKMSEDAIPIEHEVPNFQIPSSISEQVHYFHAS